MIGVLLSIPLTFYISRRVDKFAMGLFLSYFAGVLAGGVTSLLNVFAFGAGVYDGAAFLDLFVQMIAHPIAAIIFFLFWVARQKQHEADMERAFWICPECEGQNGAKLTVCEKCGFDKQAEAEA